MYKKPDKLKYLIYTMDEFFNQSHSKDEIKLNEEYLNGVYRTKQYFFSIVKMLYCDLELHENLIKDIERYFSTKKYEQNYQDIFK